MTSREKTISRSLGVLLCGLLVLTAVVPAAVGTAGAANHTTDESASTHAHTWNPTGHTSRIRSLTVSGPGVVNATQPGTYLWKSEPYSLNVSFDTGTVRNYDVCVTVNGSENVTNRQSCMIRTVPKNETITLGFDRGEWPKNATGEQRITVTLRDHFAPAKPVLARETVHATVISKTGDLDNDGLTNQRELQHHTNFTRADTDGDGLNDGVEVDTYHTNPRKADTNGDFLPDGFEILVGIDPTNGVTPVLFPLLALLLPTVAGAWLWRRRPQVSLPTQWRTESDAVSTPEQPETVEHRPATGSDTESVARPAPESEPRPVSPPLTDNDQVIQLLRDHGGRLPQSDIVDETGWSKSKVSRLLSKMEGDGQISKIDLGRKNLIALTGDEPDWAGSPFDE